MTTVYTKHMDKQYNMLYWETNTQVEPKYNESEYYIQSPDNTKYTNIFIR